MGVYLPKGLFTSLIAKYRSGNTAELFILLLSVFTFFSCSTAKNTAVRRGFHQMKVKYNIFFNGNTAFLEGQQAIINANEDDFSHVLNLYPVSNHKAAESSAAQMETTIEKCRKCIKLHSIQVKPKINPRKRNDPKYKLWLSQEEFNNQMGNAWLRLGEAEFHKGDFLGSIGTFSYVAKHYANDPDMVARCQLWMARAYSEVGWEHEADDMLNKTNVDNLKREHAPLYAATSADILIKKKLYSAAIPFVEKALPAEKRNLYKPRFQYVLGQLYELNGKKSLAYASYKKVVRMTPPIDMDFNARIKLAQLNPKRALKKLNTMAHLSKYNDKMEVIYGAMGDIYQDKKDTVKAMEFYYAAIDTSQEANYVKAAILIKAGDICYAQKKYREAQPLYKEASNIITSEHTDYERITNLLEGLDELIKEYETIQLQDSLLWLSTLSQQEQMAKVQELIERLKQKEKEDTEKALQQERDNQNKGLKSVDTRKMFGDKSMDNSWYFYNDQLVRTGKNTFREKWGNRQLEDNWRRTSRGSTSSAFTDPTMEDDDFLNPPMSDAVQSAQTDTTNTSSANSSISNATSNDKYHPAFYLQQIPKTEEDKKNANTLVRNALYDMIFTYVDKIGNFELAQETFDEFVKRFPDDSKLPDLYFFMYMHCVKTEQEQVGAQYKETLLSRFPKSKQAIVLSDPNYLAVLQQTVEEQDALYEKTYSAFKDNDFDNVKKNTKLAKKKYSLSPLLPNFLFLDAIATARTDGQKAFIKKLQQLLEDYPNSEQGAMAKTFLSLMNEGHHVKKGDLASDLNEMREQSLQEQQTNQQNDLTPLNNNFKSDINLPACVVFVVNNTDEKMLNNLLYEIALFNFSQFLIKDFDIKVSPIFGEGAAVRVQGFENLNETKWYVSLIIKNEQLSHFITENHIQTIPITEENLKLVNTKFTLNEYLEFYKKL